MSATLGHCNDYCVHFRAMYGHEISMVLTVLIKMIEILTKDNPCLASWARYEVLLVNANIGGSFTAEIVTVRTIVLYIYFIVTSYIKFLSLYGWDHRKTVGFFITGVFAGVAARLYIVKQAPVSFRHKFVYKVYKQNWPRQAAAEALAVWFLTHICITRPVCVYCRSTLPPWGLAVYFYEPVSANIK